jgi:hypothetical protein
VLSFRARTVSSWAGSGHSPCLAPGEQLSGLAAPKAFGQLWSATADRHLEDAVPRVPGTGLPDCPGAAS